MKYSKERFGVTSYDDLDLSSLPDQFTPHPDIEVGYIQRAGRDIRYASLMPIDDIQAQVIIVPGNQESLEKYFEFINYLKPEERNWATHVFEPFSQGGSGRYEGAEDYAHSENFDHSIDDLQYFINHKVLLAPNRPIVLIGHSKGGHFCVRYLEESGANTPVTAAFLTSPMMGLNFKTEMAEPFIQLLCNHGKDKDPIRKNKAKRLTKLSDDPFRRALHRNWIDIGAYKPTQGVTTGWLKNAYPSMRKARSPERLKNISVPVTIAYGDNEKVVSKKHIERAIEHIPNCESIKIFNGKHDPIKGLDSIRERITHNIKYFIIDHIEAHKNDPSLRKPFSKLNL